MSCQMEYQSLQNLIMSDQHRYRPQHELPLLSISVVPSASLAPSGVAVATTPNNNRSNNGGNNVTLGSPREMAAILASVTASVVGTPPPDANAPVAVHDDHSPHHQQHDNDPTIEESLRAIATHRHLTNLGLV
jgi:hypothetical protein